MEPADVKARLAALDDVLTAAEANVAAVAGRSKLLAMKKAMELAQFLISRLRAGWNESGMWDTVGTLASGSAWLAAVVTLPVAFAIYFAGSRKRN